MRRRLLSGLLLVASALATLGAAYTAEGPVPDRSETLESTPYSGTELGQEAGSGYSKVDVRSGLLSESGSVSDAAEAASPVAVRVRDINLVAPVLSVGVDSENRFDVPAADTVGWYKYSSLPGTAGATVLAAHVDYSGTPGAFFNLRQLRVGDLVDVEMSDGAILTYAVTNNTSYDKGELPADELFRKDGEPVLQLITCGGTFDPQAHSYEANLVVSAEQVAA